jgi:hypothetical protein
VFFALVSSPYLIVAVQILDGVCVATPPPTRARARTCDQAA